MTIRHDVQFCMPPSRTRVPAAPLPHRSDRGARIPGCLLAGGALAAIWAGLHADDPASWIVGAPAAILGAAVGLLLPPAALQRISVFGALRFATFALRGIIRGALDVAWRSLDPASLKPGLLIWHTALSEGGARRLFALTITLLPGTLTARLDGGTLVIHTLDRSAATRADIGTLEARIAGLFHLPARQEHT